VRVLRDPRGDADLSPGLEAGDLGLLNRKGSAEVTGVIVKRVHVLADGRELIYFDDADTTLPPERAPDLRELGGRPATG
jgi:hypothetical protein